MNTIADDSWIENLSWPQVEQRITTGATAILPIGAASKEHGRHLPLNTDFRQVRWLAEQISRHHNVLVWPIVSYGYYPAFIDYPGSVSIDADIFSATISSILQGIIYAGVPQIMILNTGISTIRPLERAISAARGSPKIVLHNVYSGAEFQRAESRVCAQSFGGHADELETSLMLAIDESVVQLEVAKAQPTPIVKGLFNRTDPEQHNYSPDGVNGDPSLASRDKGRILLQALLADCLRVFAEL